jgi:hypothetical protein
MFYLFRQGKKVMMNPVTGRDRESFPIEMIVKKYGLELIDQMGFVVNTGMNLTDRLSS